MEKIITALIILLLTVSCSLTSRTVIVDDSSKKVVSGIDGLYANDAQKARTGQTGTKSADNAPDAANPDEDDDISALLGHSDSKDFDIPIVFNDAVKYYIVYFTGEKRKVFANWLRRSRRYVPMIREILKEHGLPEDLVYLAMIESGFNPKAYSPAAACGPWQFIYATGGRYGLKVNFWIDERRDPEKSTVAAAQYLTDLFNQFGCWYLAAAGYNAGEGRVGRAIEKYNTSDFWELAKYNALPKETREYIPKLIAASIIAKDPERFGFGNITYEEPVRFVEARVPRATPLSVIAQASSMGTQNLKSINPELLRGITPPDMDDYTIKLPLTTDAKEFGKALESAMTGMKRIQGVVAYKVRKRDTLKKILKRHRVREEEIRLVNSCDEKMKFKPGTALYIPKFSSHSVLKKSDVTVVESAKPLQNKAKSQSVLVKADKERKTKESAARMTGKRVKPETVKSVTRSYHVVQKGETLLDISAKYGLDMVRLKGYNNLKNEKVYPKMKLRLVSHSQKKKPAAMKVHTVRAGDTLAGISKKYDVGVADLKAANHLKNEKVRPKMRLKIPSDQR